MQKSRWIWIIQFLVSIGFISLLFFQIQWIEFFSVVRDLKIGFIILGLLLLIASHLVKVIRWHLLLPSGSVSFIQLISYYGLGIFGNYFLPTGYGGDGIRIALLSQNVSIKLSFVSVALDRIFGFITVILFFLIGLQIGFPFKLDLGFTGTFYRMMIIVFIILIIALSSLLLLIPQVRNYLFKLIKSINFKSYLNYGIDIGILNILIILLLSIASQLLLVLVYWMVLNSLSINIPFSASVWMVTIFSIVLFLPISINGLGVQENIGIMILEYYGVMPISAISVVLIIRTYSIFLSAFGGLFYLLNKKLRTPISEINDKPVN